MPPTAQPHSLREAATVVFLHAATSIVGGFSVVLPVFEGKPLIDAWSNNIRLLLRAVDLGLGFYVVGAVLVVTALPLGLALLDLTIRRRNIRQGWVVMLAGGLVGGCSATVIYTIVVFTEPAWVPRLGGAAGFALRIGSPFLIALWAMLTVPAALIAHTLAWAILWRRHG